MGQEMVRWEGETFILLGPATDPILDCAGCENPAEGGSRMVQVGKSDLPSFVWCADCLATAMADGNVVRA